MIKLLFVLPPFPSMEKDSQRVLSAYQSKEEIVIQHKPCTFYDLLDYHQDEPCDAVIARGLSADVLAAQALPYPIIRMPFSSSEIIDTVIRCKEQFQAKHVGIIGNASLAAAAEVIRKISVIPINIYFQESTNTDLSQRVNQALLDGCDAIIGGGTAYNYAASIQVPALMVCPSFDTLWHSVDEAVNAVNVQRIERANNLFLRSIIDNASDGFILLNQEGKMVVSNKFAETLFGFQGNHSNGLDILQLIPELAESISAAVNSRKSASNMMVGRNGKDTTIDIQPMEICGKDNTLVVIHDISKIQALENQIRSKLYAKGMVARYSFSDIINCNEKMRTLIETSKKFSQVDSSILIVGETGTGKELLAQSIHTASKRSLRPFVAVNCAAIPENLLESELFGYAPGAFTGAARDGKAGLFESAHNGTLFLDEVSELPLTFQSKLLRVLQEREIRRIGDNRVIPINIRIIAATNKSLPEMIETGTFRKDLYYRLNVLELSIPALATRKEDIIPLFTNFMEQYAKRFSKGISPLSPSEEEILLCYPWPGNIRELRNVAERYAVLFEPEVDSTAILRRCIPSSVDSPSPISGLQAAAELTADQRQAEITRIKTMLKQARSKTSAAKALGISRATLYRKLREYGIG